VLGRGELGRYVLPLLFLLDFFGCVGVFPKKTMRGFGVDVSLPQLVLHAERYPLISMEKLVLWDKPGTDPRFGSG